MIDQLVFDTTDANTIADSHHVGAHTLSGTGDLITSGDGDSDNLSTTAIEGLDVRSFLYGYDSSGDNWDRLKSTNGVLHVDIQDTSINVEANLDGIYDNPNNLDPDNVGIIAHTRAGSIGDTQQVERTTAGGIGSILSANKGNINALDVNAFLYAENDTSGDLELPKIADADDGLIVHIANEIIVNDSALANTSIATNVNTLAVADTAEDVVPSPLSNRKYLYIYNNDNRRLFIGQSGVTSTDGFPLSPKGYIMLRAGASVDIEWVSPKVGHDMRHMELS